MPLIEAPVRIAAEVSEHSAVVHMVTVDNDVVAEPRRTALVDVGHAIVAVCLVKAVLQVVIRIIRRLHDGIVDARFVNGDPTDEVIVLFKKSAIFQLISTALNAVPEGLHVAQLQLFKIPQDIGNGARGFHQGLALLGLQFQILHGK